MYISKRKLKSGRRGRGGRRDIAGEGERGEEEEGGGEVEVRGGEEEEEEDITPTTTNTVYQQPTHMQQENLSNLRYLDESLPTAITCGGSYWQTGGHF